MIQQATTQSEALLTGEVVYGDQRGRVLGFPTANLRIDRAVAPRFGVYAGRLDGRPAAVSVGVRPTFGGASEPLVEAHVLDFAGDLYGRNVRIELLEMVREEEAFPSADALTQQIREDVRMVRKIVTAQERDAVARFEGAADALRRGETVVLDGSAVGDGTSQMVVAADRADADAINRMAADARGLVALALPASRCDALRLPTQPEGQHPRSGRRYALSIEARHGVTTGISAQDRAVTIAAAIAPTATADDLVVPGHVFPVRVANGGVIERAATEEAAVDLVVRAGMTPAAVICAMLDDHGDVANRETVIAYAEERRLVVCTPSDVLAFRRSEARSWSPAAPRSDD